jgi:hypothetical protein
MSGGQVSQVGAQITLNHLLGNAVPVVSGTAPGTPIPGQWWIDSASSYSVQQYNGTAWVVDTGARYLALLTADPTALPAVLISDLVEVTTPGYARQLVTWTDASAAYPSVADNSDNVTWGPMTANMALGTQWVALVTVASGTTGLFLYAWTVGLQQVNTSESIQLAASEFSLAQA